MAFSIKNPFQNPLNRVLSLKEKCIDWFAMGLLLKNSKKLIKYKFG